MKKQIMFSLAIMAMVLGINSFAQSREDRSYAELTVMQQEKYNKLSQEEKKDTTAVFGYKVYGAKNDVSNNNGQSNSSENSK